MRARRQIVILIAALGVLLSAGFPPFAYDQSTVVISGIREKPDVTTLELDWAYLGHHFFWETQPVLALNRSSTYIEDGKEGSIQLHTNAGVAWKLVALQIVLIVLVAAGALLMLRSSVAGSAGRSDS